MFNLLTPFKLISCEDILNIIDPFNNATPNIMLSAPSPIKVSANLINMDVLLESPNAQLSTPLYGIFIPTLNALVADVNKLLQVQNVIPKTKIKLKKLIDFVPLTHAGFTCCFRVMTTIVDKLNSLQNYVHDHPSSSQTVC